jgi:hypothetical protein
MPAAEKAIAAKVLATLRRLTWRFVQSDATLTRRS